jgi:hypothetical protein
LFHAAELDERLAAGFGGAHARAQIVVHVHAEMTFHLGDEF